MTPDQEQLLRLYSTQATMSLACEIAGVDGSQHYVWLNTSAEYRQVFSRINREKLDDYWKRKHGGEG